MSNPLIVYNPNNNSGYALQQDACSSSTTNPELANFVNLIEDANTLSASRREMALDSAKWTAISNEIGRLVQLAVNLGQNNNHSADARSRIYGQIMLIITAEYLPTISNYLGDQILEQAALENIASDVSAFIIDAQTGFNNLAACPDETQCTDNFKLYSGVMALVSGNSSLNNTITGITYTFNLTVVDQSSGLQTNVAETNILNFLTDTNIWGSSTPLTTTETSQISSGLTSIGGIFNSGEDTTTFNSWNDQDFVEIDTAINNWTVPYPADNGTGCVDCTGCTNCSGSCSSGCYNNSSCNSGAGCDSTSGTCCSATCNTNSGDTSCFCSNNAPLVYTDPNTIQEGFNQASQAVETVATSTQTIENFQIQEIDQFYGITNSIQQSQEQQCAAMVKQQTA